MQNCALLLIATALACSSEEFTQDTTSTGGAAGTDGGGAGGTSGTGGTTGTGGTGGSDGGGCDTSRSPSEEACLVADEYAVFVSPNGKELASGKKNDPVKSIADAVSLAGSSKRVIVCEGTYDEHVKLSGGAKIYGGFDCSTWAYQSGKQSTVSPSTVGYALVIDSVITEVILEDLAFVAKDGSAPGASSVAAFVKNSGDVRLARVKLQAGNGVQGANGVLFGFTFTPQVQLDGNSAALAVGGAAKTCACKAGDNTTGGKGGTAPATGGSKGLPDHGGGNGGLAGTPTNCSGGGTGQNGSSPAPAENGPGATTVGKLTAAGWEAQAGGAGKPGGAGQGGGGGASGATGGGGGGGCGGCGGAGGPGGGGGGGSIALLSLSSNVTIADSELVTANGGTGGNGAAGQLGQTDVGFGGPPAAGGCQGGAGGHGGTGGAGGGGAGGVSAGVVYAGTKPDLTGTNVSFGTKGSKGSGAGTGNDGIDGIEAETIAAQ